MHTAVRKQHMQTRKFAARALHDANARPLHALPRIVLGALGLRQSATVQARYISLLRLIRLGRVYRLQKVRRSLMLLITAGRLAT